MEMFLVTLKRDEYMLDTETDDMVTREAADCLSMVLESYSRYLLLTRQCLL